MPLGREPSPDTWHVVSKSYSSSLGKDLRNAPKSIPAKKNTQKKIELNPK